MTDAKDNKSEKPQTLVVEHGHKVSSVAICLQGATVTSWKIANTEMLFLSKKAIFAPGKAIRGGVPIVFPQFGPGTLPQHGFARNNLWTHKETTFNKASGDATTIFTFSDTAETRKVWPYAFQLTFTVVLKATSLSMQLQVLNKEAEKPFSFTALLHTYFRVSSIHKATVSGLQGKTYIDKLDSSKEKEEKDSVVKFSSEVDRVYKNSTESLYIGDGGNADIMLMRTGFKDVVVWNPWVDKSKTMADFGADEYLEMVCVEAGAVSEPVTLQAGKTWEGAQGLSLRILDNKAAAGGTGSKM